MLVSAILDGQLKPGAPVPATRDLGRQLRVSRNTVTAAYEELISEGYLYTERAVGTFVCKTLPDTLIGHAPARPEHRSGSLHRAMNLPLPYGGRGLTGLHRPSSPRLIADFVFGRSDARNFPEKIWRKLIVECLGGAAERMSEYIDPAGLPELRQLITARLGPTRGMVAPQDFILIAEETGVIKEIDEWVMREACRAAAQWQRAGYPLVQRPQGRVLLSHDERA